MAKYKSNSIDSFPIEIFKHCIGWNSSNIPRTTEDGTILYSYRNKFILNSNDHCLDKSVAAGYMVVAPYTDKFKVFTLTDKGFKYIEEKENITIVKNVNLQKIHEYYVGENLENICNDDPCKSNKEPMKKRGRKKKQ